MAGADDWANGRPGWLRPTAATPSPAVPVRRNWRRERFVRGEDFAVMGCAPVALVKSPTLTGECGSKVNPQ